MFLSNRTYEGKQKVGLQRKYAEAEAPFAIERALVGEHPAIAKLRALIERVAPAEVTVLITGESGTGKEVVAQAIHTLSPRCNQSQSWIPPASISWPRSPSRRSMTMTCF